MQLKMQNLKCLIPLVTTSVMLVGCSSSTDDVAQADKGKVPDTTTAVGKPIPVVVSIPVVVPTPEAPAASTLTLTFAPTKAFHFSWVAVTGATSYKLEEAVTNGSGYELVKETTATSFDHIVPLYARVNSKYILQSCNAGGCTASAEVFTSAIVADMAISIAYLKAGNTGTEDHFGNSVSLSKDGNTLAVGAYKEDSSLGIYATPDNNSATDAGAVYVFTRNNTSAAWSAQAYLKAINAGGGANFGTSVSLSADGNILAVGANLEDTGSANSGAAYVFTRSVEGGETTWRQRNLLKAGNAKAEDNFGISVSLSADGKTLAVGARYEDSNAAGVNTPAITDGSGNITPAVNVLNSGAVYIFARAGEGSNTTWPQKAHLKASNPSIGDKFGSAMSLSEDGNTLAVGVFSEDSNQKGVGGDGGNDIAISSGAVYVFARTVEGSNTTWSQQAYLKASNADPYDFFGKSVSISADGNTLAVGAYGESSDARGINGEKGNNFLTAISSGAAYVFIRELEAWTEQAYVKASNTHKHDHFGYSVSINADGNTLAVSAYIEDSGAAGINGVQTNSGSPSSGAVYTYARSAATWFAQAYIKASNTGKYDLFGYSVVLSADGGTLAVGASYEDSNATTGVNADQKNGDATDSGAVYVY